jgi:hypothetical protein
LGEVVFSKNMGAGNLGIFLILAYMSGSLVQAVGNLIEWLWWKLWKGVPTDWVRTGRATFLSEAQTKELENRISAQLNLHGSIELSQLNQQEWHALTRQIHAEVAALERSQRLELFTATYGLNRGLMSALLLVCAIVVVQQQLVSKWSLLFFLFSLVALFRMHRFGIHYAQELFVEFLQLSGKSQERETK